MINTQLFFAIFGWSHQNPILDNLMIFGAEYLIFVSFAILFSLLIIGKTTERKVVLLAIFSLVLSASIRWVIQHLYFEPRPFVTFPISTLINHAPDAAFPSGHTTMISSMAFAFWFYKSKLTPFFIFFLIWIGIARIFVGVHYPFDILGGLVLGFSSVGISYQIIKLLKNILASKGDAFQS